MLLMRTPGGVSRVKSPTRCSNVIKTPNSVHSFSTIPVIDIRPLVDRGFTLSDRLAVGERLHEACSQVGFFYAINHGISQEFLTEVRQSARKWFSFPVDVKRKIQASPGTHFRGYQALGENVTQHEEGFSRDHHEAIDFMKEMVVDPRESLIHGPNIWPNEYEAFASLLKEYFNQMKDLGAQVAAGISLGLGLEEDAFEPYSNDPYWGARVIHYPPLCKGQGHRNVPNGMIHEAAQNAKNGSEVARTVQLSCGEHSDYGLLTFVNQDDHLTALQVKNAAGDWINAEPIPGSFVCNIGDMYNILTNGRYTATRHRVLNTDTEASRISIAYFFEPNFDAEIRPLEPLLKADGGAKKDGIKYGKHLEAKVFQNFDFLPTV